MAPRPLRSADDAGSIPLVLLAAIVLGGLIVALYVDVATGQRLASADRDFHQSVQVADAGLQEAFVSLAALEDTELPPVGEYLEGDRSGVLGRGTYEWSARRVDAHKWQVRSVGTFGTHERVLEAAMGPENIFALAAFADVLIELRGANWADSYDGSSTDSGRGMVGSNQEIVLRGNAEVDWVLRYGGATYNDGGVIRDGGGIETGDHQDLPDLGGRAYSQEGVCSSGPEYDDIADVGTLERGETYCVAQARFHDGEHLLTGTSTDPTRIFIAPSGNLELLGQGNQRCDATSCVNWTVGEDQPAATDLEIYLASGGGEVLANNYSVIAAGIYAPYSNCSGPNAQGDVYGSIVCRTLDSKGGWNFHYDERFDEVATAYFSIQAVREEPGGTTSFDGP